jgi:hypothetical protein
MQRQRDGACGEIGVQRQFAAQQGEGIALRPLPLRDTEFAEVLARCAGTTHGVVGQQGEALVGASGAVWPDVVTRETAELGN